MVTFVVAVNNRKVFRDNFMSSPCLGTLQGPEVLVQEHFNSAAIAYNDALEKSSNDLVVFCHQDMILPENWITQLQEALSFLAKSDPNWGVLGCYGKTRDGRGWGYVYSSGRGIIGKPFVQPTPVQTLDEIVLIVRKSSGLRFDPSLPHFHFYGADICLRAASMGMRNYVISAFCVHNTVQTLVLPKEFYDGYEHVRRTWSHALPIQTTCVRMTRFGIPLRRRRLQEWYLRHVRRCEIGGKRIEDVQALVRTVKRLLERRPGLVDQPSQGETL
jgi:glycosyltransferase involved in cell wall biosynthesis